MSKSDYPSTVIYFDQVIDTKISLKEEFRSERKAMRALQEAAQPSKYLTLEMQDNYVALIDDENFFTDIDEEVLDGEYYFILTCEENPRIIFSTGLHHSYLANGKKVLAAGSLAFDRGTLVKLTNNSGHYRPTDEEMLPVIKALYLASGKTLKLYESFCNNETLKYPVAELVISDEFSQVRPLKESEYLDIETGQRAKILGDYEVTSTTNPEQRFGRRLSPELTAQYSEILSGNTAFFTSTVSSEKQDVIIGVGEESLTNLHS